MYSSTAVDGTGGYVVGEPVSVMVAVMSVESEDLCLLVDDASLYSILVATVVGVSTG